MSDNEAKVDLQKAVMLPDICQKHQSLLVSQAGYGPDDPWRALVIATNIALFQAATTFDDTHKRLGGDIKRLPELGCLACYRPDAFGEIVEAAKSHDLKAIKAVGMKYIEAAKKP